MNREVAFFQSVTQQRPGGMDLRSQAEVVRMALYINRTADLAQSFEIEGFPSVKVTPPLPTSQQAIENTLLPSYFEVESFMNAVYP